MSFGIYLVGFILFIIGIGYALTMANVPGQWIAVAVLALLGIGIMMGVSRTRMKDPS